MFSTNFNDNLIPRINEILKFVLENPHSEFYRDKYAAGIPYPIRSYGDFQKIPFLTKDEFLGVDVKERTFVPEKNISYFSISSGTTNRNRPTIIPHSDFNLDYFLKYDYREDIARSRGVSKIMILRPVTSPLFMKFMALPREGIAIIPGDVKNLSLSAKIAAEIKVQGFVATPTILDFLIPLLQTMGFDLEAVQYIKMGGEFYSKQKLAYFKETFPNAHFDLAYGCSESGGARGYKCSHMNDEPEKYHPVDHILFEIAENDAVLPFNEAGEIIVTDLDPKAFPLIRYKTADSGLLVDEKCPCGKGPILTLGGRMEFDVFKFNGITLNAQAIEDSLQSIRDLVFSTRFQMHVMEERASGEVKPRLRLDIKLKERYRANADDPYFKEMIKDKVSEGLRLSADNTLKQLADKNIFLPLSIEFVDDWPKDQIKSKPIISHLT